MNILTVTGIVTDVFPIEQYQRFEKKVFWLQEDHVDKDILQNHFQFDCINRYVSLLNNIKPGDHVEVRFEVVGKKQNKAGKSYVFNTLKCEKITVLK